MDNLSAMFAALWQWMTKYPGAVTAILAAVAAVLLLAWPLDRRPRLAAWLWVIVGAGFLAAAGMTQGPLERRARENQVLPQVENHPGIAALMTIPGGLRAPIINALWIETEELKNKGRFFDAMQRAKMICDMEPHFAGVWGYQAWNMAWNISVQAHTPEERWQWVHNGVRLLRDQGIPLNPKSILLYKELSWIFFSKMGGTSDDMHDVYKKRWAALMQHLLGSPPMGETDEVVAAFRLIAQAPLDKDPRQQGRESIQTSQLNVLMQDPQVAKYVSLLTQKGVTIDEGLLAAYNRFSPDDLVQMVRAAGTPDSPQNDREKAVAELISDKQYAAARNKLLAFVRAQILWNVYRMDPQYMLGLMETYGPLDWRHTWSHGLYWGMYGIQVCKTEDNTEVDSLNSDRNVLNCLKELTWYGRMTYIENPSDPEDPEIRSFSDYRFIKACHDQHIRFGKLVAKADKMGFDENALRVGHINYLVSAIKMLYAGHRYRLAQEYLDWIKTNYKETGGEYKLDLEGFVLNRMEYEGDQPIAETARSQITAALQVAFVSLINNDTKTFNESVLFARKVYVAFQSGASERVQLPPFGQVAAMVVAELLIEPRIAGYNISLIDRGRLYGALDNMMRLNVYVPVSRFLRPQCERAGLKMDRLFPMPDGLEEFLQQQSPALAPPPPPRR